MNSGLKFNYSQSKPLNINLLNLHNNQTIKSKKCKTINFNLSLNANDISTIDTELSFKNNSTKSNASEPQKLDQSQKNLKKSDKLITELFKIYSEQNSLCNFLIFEKTININMNLGIKFKKKITLSDYLDIFNKPSFLCLNIPFIEKNGKVTQNVFYSTLSSMVLVIKSKKKLGQQNYEQFINNNFSVCSLSDNLTKIEYNETSPPYYRDTLYSKIKIIHKIIGKKRIMLDDIIKDKSYISILWIPADTYKINSSFLSYYTFDFKLIGTLIIKNDENMWLSNININNTNNNGKDFKKDYLININNVETFINNNSKLNQIERKIPSNDYNRYIYSNNLK